MEIKYYICPGTIRSKTDGDSHYIGAAELMRLYGVSPAECKVIDSPESAAGLDWGAAIQLRPDATGEYLLPSDENPDLLKS